MNDATAGALLAPPLSGTTFANHEPTAGVDPQYRNSTRRDEDTWSDATRERTSLAFRSILFEGAALVTKGEEGTAPAYFCDLNLDHVLDSIGSGREEYDLAPFFCEHVNAVRIVVDATGAGECCALSRVGAA